MLRITWTCLGQGICDDDRGENAIDEEGGFEVPERERRQNLGGRSGVKNV